MSSPFNDMDSTELDKLIHNYEFENQQCVKVIDTKNEVISSLRNQIEQQIQERKRLEEDISKFDEDTKRLHRSYTNNRDNIACLKKTMSVMMDHMEALSKQLVLQETKTAEDSKSYSEHLINYRSTRDAYMVKYKSMPLALELEAAQKTLSSLQEKDEESEERKKDTAQQIMDLETELNTKVMSRIIVKIVESKHLTEKLEEEIHNCVTEKAILLEQLKEVQKSKEDDQDIIIIPEMDHRKEADHAETDSAGSKDVDQANTCFEADPLTSDCNMESEENLPTTTQSDCFKLHGVQTQLTATENAVEVLTSSDNSGNEPIEVNDESTSQFHSKDQSGSFGSTINQSGSKLIGTNVSQPLPTMKIHKPVTKLAQVGAPQTSCQTSVPRFQLNNQSHFSGLRKLGPISRVPSVPSLPRVPPALRIPTLTVPRAPRVPPPIRASLASVGERKNLASITVASTVASLPPMKQPSPPPPRTTNPSTNINGAHPRLWPNSSLTRPSSSSLDTTVVPSLGPLSTQSQQQQTKHQIKGGSTAQPKQGFGKGENTSFSTQYWRPLPPPYLAPLKSCLGDASNESLLADSDKESGKRAPKDHFIAETKEDKSHTQREEQDMETSYDDCEHSSVCTPMYIETENVTEREGDVNEPLFKLDHTFGSQTSLSVSIPGSQSQSQHHEPGSSTPVEGSAPDASTSVGDQPRASSLPGLLAHLQTGSPGRDSEADTPQTSSKSFFNLFNISQKSRDDNSSEVSGKDGDADHTMSVLNFGKFSIEKDGDDDNCPGWSGFMNFSMNKSQSEETSDEGNFVFKFGSSSKDDDDDEGGEQSSFFNIGGGMGDFSSGDASRPLFNLF